MGAHIARHIEYARDSVYNNHLLSEALGLFVAGSLLRGESAARWKKATAIDLLLEQADRQVYPDGAYIQQSHTYHRVAMQVYLWATAFVRAQRRADSRVNGAPQWSVRSISFSPIRTVRMAGSRIMVRTTVRIPWWF